MNRIKIAGLALALLFCAAGRSMAQEQEVSSGKLADQVNSMVQEKIERSIKDQEPAWELAHRYGPRDSAVRYVWKSGEQSIRVSITYLASQEDAAQRLKLSVDAIPIGPGSEMKNLGDEAYQWLYGGGAAIRFRKGSMMIIINADPFDVTKTDASSLDLAESSKSALNIAKKFAQHIANEIESK